MGFQRGIDHRLGAKAVIEIGGGWPVFEDGVDKLVDANRLAGKVIRDIGDG